MKIKVPLKAPADGGRQFSLRISANFSVDRASGMLRNVALITVGEAKGHGLYIDERTIETCDEVVALRKGRLKAAFRHPSMLDYIQSYGADRMLEIPGYFSAVAAKGDQLVAGAFQFYDAFKKDNASACDTLLEMAEKTPELFGVSIEPYGYAVYVDTEGTEYSEPPLDRELLYNGLPALRVTDLSYAAFVDEPAANPGGVFAALSRVPVLGALLGGGRRTQLAALGQLAEAVAAFCKKGGLGDAACSVDNALSSDSTENTEAMNTLTAIHAKYGNNPEKFASACKLLAEDSKLTIDQIDAKLAAQAPAAAAPAPAAPAPAAAPKGLELSAVIAHFGVGSDRCAKALQLLASKPESTLEQLSAAIAADEAAALKRLQEENAQLKASQTKLEGQIAALKGSGHPAPVVLGAGAGTGSGNQEKRELSGLERVAAAFKADASNPANAHAGRN